MEMLRRYLPEELVETEDSAECPQSTVQPEDTERIELSAHAKALELAAKDADYQYIREHHAEVMAEYGNLIAELTKRLLQ